MGRKQAEVTTVPVQKEAHRKLKEAKPEGETWSRFLKRAVESLDSDKAFTDGEEERIHEIMEDTLDEVAEDKLDSKLNKVLAQ